ncbi:adenylyltransferase/cytidyltransferase family protein [Candidatus Fukatsuia symbiotica]|uniref:Glycerol-3-phosphate cytidylyltransferase n=1 Tax=Candidatus Fukatsuia symbiotica TaxID=1878942 RepID=A0A2U8I2K6_9GAMM|nr:adenylyltransferase/cytidyltransferase family protein [Candidatus Fukatsuia symbiotica]AWK13330.1 glycerol-3-phosphate cytidylyltransferase [Candidatus Fukatsuia symbiotica]MEA9444208.1 adenylyltransferase/cytidyltransferase family protein [Candidatus Fukatsuia symbiotica]
MKKVITFGTFDVFHIGHLFLLKRAKQLGSQLIVGISSDTLNLKKKNKHPIYCQDERLAIIRSLKCVDEVFIEESLEMKRNYLINNKADILVMGDDWTGKFDEFNDICRVIYLERTPSISTTSIIEVIKMKKISFL